MGTTTCAGAITFHLNFNSRLSRAIAWKQLQAITSCVPFLLKHKKLYVMDACSSSEGTSSVTKDKTQYDTNAHNKCVPRTRRQQASHVDPRKCLVQYNGQRSGAY